MPPAPGRASAWQACGPSQNVLSGSCSLACGDTFIVLTIIVYPMSGSPRFADRRGGLGLPRRPEGRRGGAAPGRPRRRPILLVLMGSAVGMVRRLAVDARGALYGRSTAILPLHPFTYAQAR